MICDFRIEELSNKREILSNNVNRIKRYKFKLKEVLKEGRRKRNRTEFGLEDKKYIHCYKCTILNETPGLVVLN